MADETAHSADCAILILNIRHLDNLSHISSPIAAAASRTRTRLLIVIFSPLFDNISGTGSWHAVQRLLTHAYVHATAVSQKLDRIMMGVDVILRGAKGLTDEDPVDAWDTIFYTDGAEGVAMPRTWISLSSIHLPSDSQPSLGTSTPCQDLGFPSSYPVVALGGTFDHLHAGHKILLSMAAWIAHEKIIVGVTDDTLLVKKIRKEHLESLSARLHSVRNFLRLFKPGLVYDLVAISDQYGPTAWDSNIQALVVSKETLPGAASVASLRTEKSLPPLRTFVIDVISASSTNLETNDFELLKNTKMSSTFIREWLHEQRVNNPGSTTEPK